jgi:hypothetical protein
MSVYRYLSCKKREVGLSKNPTINGPKKLPILKKAAITPNVFSNGFKLKICGKENTDVGTTPPPIIRKIIARE